MTIDAVWPPINGTCVDIVRSSCRQLFGVDLTKEVDGVSLDLTRIDAFCKETILDTDALLACCLPKQRSKDLPAHRLLKFDTLEQELNFVAVRALLSFEDDYHELLTKCTGRSTDDTIQYGMMGLFFSYRNLTAKNMIEAASELATLAQTFGVPMTEEVPMGPPDAPNAMLMTRAGPLRPFVEKLAKMLTEIGQILMRQGCSSLAQWILKLSFSGNQMPSFEPLLTALVEAFLYFRDAAVWQNDFPVYFLRKAHLLIHDLYLHFGVRDAMRFNFRDLNQLTVCPDDVLTLVLRHQGFIKVDSAVASQVALKAAAVVTCDYIVTQLKQLLHQSNNDEHAQLLRNAELADVALEHCLWQRGKQIVNFHASQRPFSYSYSLSSE